MRLLQTERKIYCNLGAGSCNTKCEDYFRHNFDWYLGSRQPRTLEFWQEVTIDLLSRAFFFTFTITKILLS